MKKYLLLSFCIFLTQKIMIANTGGGDPPVADFSYYIEFVGASAEVSFLNESIDGETYFWDFDDGGTSTDLHPFHLYPEPGIFIVCMTATNEYGSDTYCDTLITYYAPGADFTNTGDPTVIFTDLTTNFPTTWDWFFGDGDISNIQNPEHTYLANGDYNVCLSAGNPGGTSYVCHTVTISSYPVTVANFSYTGDPVVSFTDLSTELPFEWSWDFGDGSTSTIQNPNHTYTENGEFNVCLTATNVGGTNTYCENVTIIHAIAPPVAAYTYLIIDLQGAFVDESTGSPTEWLWEFGDGNTSTDQNPVYVFAEDGTFHVCLTVTNGGGIDTECKDLLFETGILETELNDLNLYPNPVDNFLIIESGKQLNYADYVIYDNTGKIILTGKNLTGNKIEINTSSFAGGKYYIIMKEYNEVVAGGQFVVGKK